MPNQILLRFRIEFISKRAYQQSLNARFDEADAVRDRYTADLMELRLEHNVSRSRAPDYVRTSTAPSTTRPRSGARPSKGSARRDASSFDAGPDAIAEAGNQLRDLQRRLLNDHAREINLAIIRTALKQFPH